VTSGHDVGPVLMAGTVADAIVAAVQRDNPGVTVQDRGAYLRVGVAGRCVLRRASVEAVLGQVFALPGDLERVMLSFVGSLHVDRDEAAWTDGGRR
jgi:hypothetical protein